MPSPRSLTLSALVLAASLATEERSSAASFKYTTLNVPGADIAEPAAANAQGQVVGIAFYDYDYRYEGFVWSAGTGSLVTGTSTLLAINDKGIAVGPASSDKTGYASFDTTTGILSDIPVSFCKGTKKRSGCGASGINNAGDVVGTTSEGRNMYVGFQWANGAGQDLLPPQEKMSNALAINKAGDILIASSNYNTFLYSNSNYTLIAFPGAVDTQPSFLTDKGDIGGFYYTGSASIGFVLSGGNYTPYSFPGATFTTVTGIGPAGQVYGWFQDPGVINHGFVYANGTYYQINVTGSADTQITGVSTSGMIFGGYSDSQGNGYGFVGTCPKKDICTQ